jgi:hypothetical protein
MDAIHIVRLLVFIGFVTAGGIAGWRAGGDGDGYPWRVMGYLIAGEVFLAWVIQ